MYIIPLARVEELCAAFFHRSVAVERNRMYDLQRASLLKRFSAFLLDIILLVMLAVAMFGLLGWILGYNGYAKEIDATYDKYYAEYGISADISEEEYDALPDEEKQKYLDASKALEEDAEFGKLYYTFTNLTLVITTFSILLAYVILELVVPIILKNGQTVGKKIFAIGVMDINGVRIKPIALFVRTILGKYTIETMIPVMLLMRVIIFGSGGPLSLIVIAALILMQIIFMATTRTHLSIHDLLSSTVTVDLPSQMIFDSVEELNEYKKRLAAEKAANSEYF